MQIDWVRKLTSRKFWVAVIGFITGLLTLKGIGADQVEKIGGIIMMGASVIAYIIGEGLADAGNVTEEIGELNDEQLEQVIQAMKPPEDGQKK